METGVRKMGDGSIYIVGVDGKRKTDLAVGGLGGDGGAFGGLDGGATFGVWEYQSGYGGGDGVGT